MPEIQPTSGSSSPETTPRYEGIAIVGMAVNLPGAPTTDELWKLLEDGINTISPIPEDRFNVSQYSGTGGKRQMKARTGNFLSNASEFDNKFFKISPREARSMDPQQRILLHAAYEALEEAGYVPNSTPSFNQETFGCYVGATAHDYVHNLQNDIDVYYSTGTLNAFLCGRVSYVLQLSGPSLVVDTACSSSSVAIYQACRALQSGDCNAALAGGVNVMTSPDLYLGLDRAHFLSPTGQCKAFDVSADGYSRSEGCVMFVLKRLSDALAESDNILGVIRSIGVNQSGHASSITHPHAPTQAKLFQSVLEDAGILDPSRINLVEAHGTGTPAGDPNELESIRHVLCSTPARSSENPLHVTSIKANIGHVETASGAAGIAKVLLMMKHSKIPPQISLKDLNPRIAPLELDHTVIDTDMVPWTASHPDHTRLALLNNFGAAGSNCAMILEEHTSSERFGASEKLPLVFGFSAKDEATAGTLRDNYIQFLQSPGANDLPLADIAYTMTARRQVYPFRAAVVASTKEQLIGRLQTAVIYQTSEKQQSRVVFVFSGQGGQYQGMGERLYRTCQLFRDEIDKCHSYLVENGFPGILSIITSPEVLEGSEPPPEAFQAAVFALEYALAKLWMSWGVHPIAVIGHSLGEYAALVVAGVFTLHDALFVVASRARLMFEKCLPNTSGMLAVGTPSEIATNPTFPGVSVACYNSPSDCVLSGSLDDLKMLKEDLPKGTKSIMLDVPFGYHGQFLEPIFDPLREVVSTVKLSPPVLPISSNVTGTLVQPGDHLVFTPEYFSRHAAEPVRFAEGMQALIRDVGIQERDIVIEIGPHPILLPCLKANPVVPSKATLLSSLRKRQDDLVSLSSSLVGVYTSNVHVKWRNVYCHVPHVSCIRLPSYPFSKQKFWVPFVEPTFPSQLSHLNTSSVDTPCSIGDFSLLEDWVQTPKASNNFVSIIETPLQRLSSLILGHSVGGSFLCPASAYLELALSAIKLSGQISSSTSILLRHNEFIKPLVYASEIPTVLKITVSATDNEYGTFQVHSRAHASDKEIIHVSGEYRVRKDTRTSSKFGKLTSSVLEHISALTHPSTRAETIFTRTAYEVIFPRVVKYNTDYQSMEFVTVSLDGIEAFARVKLPLGRKPGKYVVDPFLLDSILHVSGFVVNLHAADNEGFICHSIGSVKSISSSLSVLATYGVYCRTTWGPNRGSAVSEVWAYIIGEEKEQVVFHAEEITFKRVRMDALKRSLSGTEPASHCIAPLSIVAPSTYANKLSSMDILSPTLPRKPEHVDKIINIIGKTCGIESTEIRMDSSLDALGIDSLMTIELADKLRELFPSVSPSDFTGSASIGDLLAAIEALQCTPAPTALQLSTIFSLKERTLRASEIPSTPPYPPTPASMESVEPFSSVQLTRAETVQHVLAAVLALPPTAIQKETSLESLGLDSLASIEVIHELRSAHNIDLPDTFFMEHDSMASIKEEFDLQQQTLDPTLLQTLQLESNPTLIQRPVSDASNLPLFLIHDGSGLSSYYQRLPALNRPVYAIHNPKFLDTTSTWESLQEMANEYAALIKTADNRRDIVLGGWSFGAVAAYETARQLQQLSPPIHVAGLLLVDPPNPVNHIPMSQALIESVVKQRSSVGPDLERIRECTRLQFQTNASLLGRYEPSTSALPIALLRSKEGYSSPDPSVEVPSWLADRSEAKTALKGWENLSSRIRVWDIPGNHFTPFHSSNIKQVGQSIDEACRQFDTN